MVKIAISNTENLSQARISEFIKTYFKTSSHTEFEINSYNANTDLLDDIEHGKICDIYILDVITKGSSGINLVKAIRKCTAHPAIIFITSSPDYAVDAFKLDVTHYIVKPLKEQMFFAALDRCFEKLSFLDVPFLILKTTIGVEKVAIKNIIYIESMRQYQKVVLKGRVLTVRETLKKLYNEVESPSFIMPHRAFIVNMEHIVKITTDQISMREGSVIPIPRGTYRDVKMKFLDFHSLHDESDLYSDISFHCKHNSSYQ